MLVHARDDHRNASRLAHQHFVFRIEGTEYMQCPTSVSLHDLVAPMLLHRCNDEGHTTLLRDHILVRIVVRQRIDAEACLLHHVDRREVVAEARQNHNDGAIGRNVSACRNRVREVE